MSDEKLDAWRKAEIIGKLISSVLLGALTIAIAVGTDRVANALKKGELVQSLIQELSRPDSTISQDIALIALHRSLSEDDPLVTEIAERVFLNLPVESGEAAQNTIAFRIIRQRDSTRADALASELVSRIPAPVRRQLRSSWDTAAFARADSVPRSDTSQAVAQVLSVAVPRVVYIQFRGSVQRSLMNALRAQLDSAGYPAPGVERVDRQWPSSVRWFHPEDQALAREVARRAREFLRGRGCPDPGLAETDLSNSGFAAPPGQIELWIDINCAAR